MKNQKGFSLIELLVVVVIIGIIAAIAIPSLLAARRSANEAAAVSALRTISSAEATYQSSAGSGVNYGSLAALGTEKLIDSTLSGGNKGGYTFAMTGPTTTTGATTYCVTATPTDTALRTYAIATDGVIKVNTGNTASGGKPTCTATFTTTGDVLGTTAAPAASPL
jgi:prepilin-type N-terminal cleavage/methylation domain-containing protein